MKITKGNFLKLISEGVDVNEIINNDLSLISGGETDAIGKVTNKATTDSFVDASTQQMGKNRMFGTFMEEENLGEANSALLGKTYTVPEEIIAILKTKPNGNEGADRVQTLLTDPSMTYEQIKRFKHDIENKYQGDWKEVLGWINHVLSTDRDSINRNKQATMDTGMENRFAKTHDKQNLKPTQLTEGTDYNVYKTAALRQMVKDKREEIAKLRTEIKEIDTILKNKIKNKIDETKK